MTGVVMEAAKHLLTLCSEIGDLASDVRHSSSSCAVFVPCCSLACYGLLFRGNYCEGTLMTGVSPAAENLLRFAFEIKATSACCRSKQLALALADQHCGRCDL